MNRSKQAGMGTKTVVVLLVGLALASVHSADAQQPTKVPKIGWLGARSALAPARDVFERELRALGYIEGKNIAFEYRYAEGRLDRLPALAEELIRLKVDVLLTPATPAALAGKNATRTIPIVFYTGSDPVALGLVESLARPGGNITGFTTIEAVLVGKRLELLKETIPKLIPRGSIVESRRSNLHAIMERKPTTGTRIESATSFHGGQQRRQIRGRFQRGD